MSQPHCGIPIPVINPPDLGPGKRCLQGCSLSYPASVPFPGDPSDIFPRVISVSSTSWQGVSLGGEPASVVGWSVRRPRKFCMNSRVLSVFDSRAMNDAAQVVSELISKIMYPIPGIWLGPVYVHMPSGNVVLQLTVPGAGPLARILHPPIVDTAWSGCY